MSNVKDLRTLATAAVALLGAGVSMAQTDSDGETAGDHGCELAQAFLPTGPAPATSPHPFHWPH